VEEVGGVFKEGAQKHYEKKFGLGGHANRKAGSRKGEDIANGGTW